MTSPRRMSEAGRKMLIGLEGSRADVYFDVIGLATTGVGHLLTKDELSSGYIHIDGKRVRYGNLTDAQIDALLVEDLDAYERSVDAVVRAEIKQNQYDSLVSLCFNIGRGAFVRSTLVKKINERDFMEVPYQFRRWIYAGGRMWDGLVARREKEIERWSA